jgi:hypothetical protein
MQIFIESGDPELRNRCDLVPPYFEFGQDARVLCFMAKYDDEALMSELGRMNRGFHLPLADYYRRFDRRPSSLPVMVTALLHSVEGNLNYDHLVYLHASTTRHPVSCVVTLAHELQHVRQYLENREMLDESQQIGNERKFLRKEYVNLPHEKDAMFTSRRIAETILGRSQVSDYFNKQLEAARHLSPSEDAKCELVIWKYQTEWSETFSLRDEMESVRRQHQTYCG